MHPWKALQSDKICQHFLKENNIILSLRKEKTQKQATLKFKAQNGISILVRNMIIDSKLYSLLPKVVKNPLRDINSLIMAKHLSHPQFSVMTIYILCL